MKFVSNTNIIQKTLLIMKSGGIFKREKYSVSHIYRKKRKTHTFVLTGI